MHPKNTTLLTPQLHQLAHRIESDTPYIPADRLPLLDHIAAVIQSTLHQDKNIDISVVCTHNSRRSHFGQVALHFAATHFGIAGINTYSAGTETTAVHPHVLSTFKLLGFELEEQELNGQAAAILATAKGQKGLPLFSKTYEHSSLPASNFIAIMVCDHAAENCPYLPGCSHRLALPFVDPKAHDHQPDVLQQYERSFLGIARECFYIIKQIKPS